ncbi:HD domain-containing phosphohydrolase [Bacillus sp. AK031]
MLKNIKDSTLIYEEKRTLKWFLILFLSISIIYDGIYYFISPIFHTDGEIGFPSGFGYALYLLMFTLIPALYFFYKDRNLRRIKYFAVILYISLTLINDISIYWGNDQPYAVGNVAELFILLFSPIFVSEVFFFVVVISIFLKYITVGIVTSSPEVVLPIVLILVLASIAYILLKRFLGYVLAIKSSYNKQLEGIVKGIIATLELKDPYTKGHSERVAFYSISLAKRLNIYSEEELNSFYYACLLHDIGKIHIPDRILMKPDRLTKEEFEIIKTHPKVGAEAIKKIEKFNDSLSIILSHHERWDGKGYPEGLKGEEIPIAARITSIADAFDAMTSTRSYREALPVESAHYRILEGRGTQFDPDLLDIFKKVYPEWVEHAKKFKSEFSAQEPQELNSLRKGVNL